MVYFDMGKAWLKVVMADMLITLGLQTYGDKINTQSFYTANSLKQLRTQWIIISFYSREFIITNIFILAATLLKASRDT